MVMCAQITSVSNRLEKKTIAIASPDKFVACSNRHNKSIGKVRKTGIISIVVQSSPATQAIAQYIVHAYFCTG